MTNKKGELHPPSGYQKKLMGESHSLTTTFSKEQIDKRVAFYQELNAIRSKISNKAETVEKKYAVYGFNDTTTVRVYMRETISRIASELFKSNYSIEVTNINPKKTDGSINKDYGHVVVSIRATEPEIEALLEYIKPGSSYFTYDGEKSLYVSGDTSNSVFIITKASYKQQPKKFWRRSQSFVSKYVLI